MSRLGLGRRHALLSGVIALLVGIAAACTGAADTASPGYVVLDDLELLRARFNEDAGKVRAVFLASPT